MPPVRNLRLVESEEDRLRRLFAREDELLAELAQVRAEQREARSDYAVRERLLMLPSMDQVRKVVAA